MTIAISFLLIKAISLFNVRLRVYFTLSNIVKHYVRHYIK